MVIPWGYIYFLGHIPVKAYLHRAGYAGDRDLMAAGRHSVARGIAFREVLDGSASNGMSLAGELGR